ACLENAQERALFSGEPPLRPGEEAGEPLWRRVVLYELGNMYLGDSKIDRASECFEGVLSIVEESSANKDRALAHGLSLDGLGYCRILDGRVEEGIDLLQE